MNPLITEERDLIITTWEHPTTLLQIKKVESKDEILRRLTK